MQNDYDFIIVGSGFGGSVSALRLSRKGYRVLVLEKGRRWKADDFPATNWKLAKWLWLPALNFRGFFKITMLRHVSILSGVGVGGGSLTYANTLPRPRPAFFKSGSWAGLRNWEAELEAHYKEAERMLGAAGNPSLFDADNALSALADRFEAGKEFEATRVGIFFGEADKEVDDPYFGGDGPRRSGCNFCGSCMTGCRYNAKNTLDKNYLYLAEKEGAEVRERSLVRVIKPAGGASGEKGWIVEYVNAEGLIKRRKQLRAGAVILAGGVLGTVRLLLDMKRSHLKDLSPRLGEDVRTNNESLSLVHSSQKEKDFSKGIAIGSIFPPDEDSHIEVVRYGSGSGFWKLMGVPLGKFRTLPRAWFLSLRSRDFARESLILLFMQHLDSTLRLKRGIFNLRTGVARGEAPRADMPLARRLTRETARVTEGNPFVVVSEAILNTPLTAHILGGCVIGSDAEHGVVNSSQEVFAYRKLYICDGSTVSANPGVNPALTITAMTERVMAGIPENKSPSQMS